MNKTGQLSCSHPEQSLKVILRQIQDHQYLKWRTSYAYPQGQMRNVARKNCLTNYVFLLDMDIIPVNGLALPLATFLRSNTCVKCAYVVPTYEVDSKMRFPDNKKALLNLIKLKKAQPFHQKIFVHNQYATNSSMYEREQDDTLLHVSHNVTNFEFFYEPFYVALDKVPEHAERFVGYGFTRNTQVYEMQMAGWQFQVLSPAFAVHWGLQKKRSRPTWRERQNSNNRRKFEPFRREVFAKYNIQANKADKPTKDPRHVRGQDFERQKPRAQ